MAHRAKRSLISGAYNVSDESQSDMFRRTLKQTISHDEVRNERGLRREKRNTPSLPKLKFLEEKENNGLP